MTRKIFHCPVGVSMGQLKKGLLLLALQAPVAHCMPLMIKQL